MNASLVTRRQFTTSLAGMAALTLTGARTLLAQTPEPGVKSLTTEIFGWEIAWDAPWEHGEFSPGTEEISILNEQSGIVEETTIDWIDLEIKDVLCWAEIHIGPYPGDGNHYEFTPRVADLAPFPEDVMREDISEEVSHKLEFFVYDGVETASFVRLSGKPGEGERLGIHIVTEATRISDAVSTFMQVVTINGEPAIPAGETDPNMLQARIFPLLGTMTEEDVQQPRD